MAAVGFTIYAVVALLTLAAFAEAILRILSYY